MTEPDVAPPRTGQAPTATANTHVHELTIVEVIRETPDTVSLVFEVPDLLVPRFRYRPGQFLTLRIPSARTGSVARCYSLSSSPHLDDDLIVTVRRTEGGYASNWLCDNAVPGLRVTMLSPSGVFTPKSLDADLLMIAAGSGITPIMSIIKSALLAGTGTTYLFYANRDAGSVIFGTELTGMMTEYPDRLIVDHWLESSMGLPTAAALTERLWPYTGFDAFLCGPAAFMRTARAAMLAAGMTERHVHTEIYQSLTGDPFADIVLDADDAGTPATATVHLDGRRLELAWPRHTPLLDVLLAAGHDAPYSCREGACSACACTVRSGEVRMLRNDTLVDADLALGLTLACQSVPLTEHVDIAFDQ
ncbi:ferredoxin--NADP reductase [Nocardia brasiliensis]|uniref:ferredoxin--NADP reductase n=1 Tax=Nocardia brasiliensis TaxID=37326 RepID=UPI002457A8F6|nr:ferredoxin--NADP reductase [Nocardia brasiliensis]